MSAFEVKEGENVVLSLPIGVDLSIKSVVWQPTFFEIAGGLRGEDYAKAVKDSRETLENAPNEDGFTTLSDWFMKNRSRNCFKGIGTRLEVCYLLSSGNLVAVNNIVTAKLAFTADDTHTPTTLAQDNALCRAIAKGDTLGAIKSFIGGSLKCELLDAFFVFKKKDNTFSREFQARKWTINAPTATK